jgi:abortive infection bacteriophage resistance protein|tara:strand:+ start:24698 stop:25447 length:750 start_codon:yes stop_codon:yes gene_type:complete
LVSVNLGGFFLPIKNKQLEKMEFTKPALTIKQQSDLLKERGLIVPNEAETHHYLRTIGYYRLSGYIHFYYISKDGTDDPKIKGGTTFEKVISLYNFDRELRNITLDALEKIEITIKAIISNVMSLNYGPFWYTDSQHFGKRFGMRGNRPYNHQKLINEINSAKAPFLDHFKAKYSSSDSPPSWMALEVISFGALSIMFSHLKRVQIRSIANEIDVSPVILANWLQICSYLRNICAHHARLWNRKFVYRV